MKTYHFDCGNSTDGPIGLSARIKAQSSRQAVTKLRRAIEDLTGPWGEVTLSRHDVAGGYVTIYISPENIKKKHIHGEERII